MLKAKIYYQLSRRDRLVSEKQIELLFANGKPITLGCLRMIYLSIEEMPQVQIKAMFSVPKKTFKKAVDRNYIKRRMKESYRLMLPELNSCCPKSYLLAIIYIDKGILNFSIIQNDMNQLINKFIQRLAMK